MNTFRAAIPRAARPGRLVGDVPAALTFQSTIARCSYRAIMASSRAAVFGGGSTLGIANEVVTPPAAQALVAVTMSSLWVKLARGDAVDVDGSRRRWRSVVSIARDARAASPSDRRDPPPLIARSVLVPWRPQRADGEVVAGHGRVVPSGGPGRSRRRISARAGSSWTCTSPATKCRWNHSTMSGFTTSRYWA